MSAPAPAERAALSRELAEFLIELSIALHKDSMYPEGHPSLEPAAVAVTRRASQLHEARATIGLGVARQQLVIEGVATDPKNPVLADLAGRLHRHHLGAITFHRGVRAGEVADVLRTLAVEAERTREPLGLGPRERLRAWEHVSLHPLTYERLELLDAPPEAEDEAAAQRGVRAAQLWVGLARAALAVEAAAAEDPPPPTEPVVLAQAIDAHPRSAAYDQVIVGYLLQIADELKKAGGVEALALRRHTSKLVGALQPATLRRLIEMGGDSAQRTQFAIDATYGLAADAILDIVRAMADAAHRTISDPLVRMLAKLARHAQQGGTPAGLAADEALREQVRDLLTGWTLEDPTPESYGRNLHRLSAAALAPAAAAPPSTAAGWPAEPIRVLQTGLEVGVLGLAAWRAIEHLIAEHRVGAVVDVLSAPPAGAQVEPVWSRLLQPEVVDHLAASEPPDFPTLDRMLGRMPPPAFDPLLDALARSESRATRRGLLDRLARAPCDVAGQVAARLGRDAPWYVVRNLLCVLDSLPGPPPQDFSAAPFVGHADARVRREALKLALKLPAERERALLEALRDPDPLIARRALTTALEGCPPAALSLVAAVARDPRAAAELRGAGHQGAGALGQRGRPLRPVGVDRRWEELVGAAQASRALARAARGADGARVRLARRRPGARRARAGRTVERSRGAG
ncbi:MAG: hypothetical protein ACREMN_10895, partial [Gemmatimonadales bacterium]